MEEKFLKLTDKDGDPVLVNISFIQTVYRFCFGKDKWGAQIVYAGDGVLEVQETVCEILERLKQAGCEIA